MQYYQDNIDHYVTHRDNIYYLDNTLMIYFPPRQVYKTFYRKLKSRLRSTDYRWALWS